MVSQSPGEPGPIGALSISAAAQRLHTTPRMVRYRESLGLLPRARPAHRHRRYGERDLQALAYAVTLEQIYDVSPKALAFALRALTDPEVHDDLVRLSELTGRHPAEDGQLLPQG